MMMCILGFLMYYSIYQQFTVYTRKNDLFPIRTDWNCLLQTSDIHLYKYGFYNKQNHILPYILENAQQK